MADSCMFRVQEMKELQKEPSTEVFAEALEVRGLPERRCFLCLCYVGFLFDHVYENLFRMGVAGEHLRMAFCNQRAPGHRVCGECECSWARICTAP
jgi:hypothetical protein